jgi:Domain of unknown function (DUF4192)
VASLLAFTAWQCGNGALANIALDRALDDDPSYSLAKLLREALDAGAPPELARVPCTPQEAAELYAERDGGKRGMKPDGTMEPEQARRHSSGGAPTPPCSPNVIAPRNSSATRSPLGPNRR